MAVHTLAGRSCGAPGRPHGGAATASADVAPPPREDRTWAAQTGLQVLLGQFQNLRTDSAPVVLGQLMF